MLDRQKNGDENELGTTSANDMFLFTAVGHYICIYTSISSVLFFLWEVMKNCAVRIVF